MKKIILVCLLVGLMAAAAGCVVNPGETEGITITNTDGSTTQIAGSAERIVLLNSNAGEILYLLDEADRIVGISQSIANNAEQAAMYPKAKVVGAWNEPDVEYLISMDVDVVLGYATSKPKNAEVLASSGIAVVYVDCTKPKTMAADIIEIGRLVGKTAEAEAIAAYYESVMQEVEAAAKLQTESSTIYAESYTAWYGQGTDTGMGQLITVTGGTNIMEDAGSKKLSDEWVVTQSPEIIVKLVNSMENPEEALNEVETRRGFDRVSAVQNDKTWLIRNDLTYGPRSCAAAVALYQMQYPEGSLTLTPEGVLETFNEKFGTDFETEKITYPAL